VEGVHLTDWLFELDEVHGTFSRTRQLNVLKYEKIRKSQHDPWWIKDIIMLKEIRISEIEKAMANTS
jgi:hypothetical protein